MKAFLLGWISLILSTSASANSLRCPRLNELSAEAQKAVANGETVLKELNIQKVWPLTCTYTLLKAEPEQAAAVFADYGAQSTYVSSIKKSEVVGGVVKKVTQVFYRFEQSIAKDEYTVEDTLSKSGSAYSIHWKLISAKEMKDTRGYAVFMPQGSETLLVYMNWVDPSGMLAKIPAVKAMGLKATKKTVGEIRAHLQKKVNAGGSYLNGQVAKLRQILAN